MQLACPAEKSRISEHSRYEFEPKSQACRALRWVRVRFNGTVKFVQKSGMMTQETITLRL